jgi:DNA-binding FadR family transcriptional regulator
VSAGQAVAAEDAMRRHLLNVADAVKRGRLPGGIDSASRGVL